MDLQESDFLLVRQAAHARRAIRSAGRTASVSAWITLALAAIGLPCLLLWPSWSGAMMTGGLCFVGVIELKGCRRLRRAEPAAATALGRNQLIFLGLIVLYCVAQMLAFSPQQAKAAAVSPEFRSQLAAMPSMEKAIDRQIERWAPVATYGFYGLVILVSILSQGGLALYYFSRRKHILAFNRQVPEGVRRLFAETGA